MSSSDLYDLTVASHLIVEQFLLSQGYSSSASQLRTDASSSGLRLPPLPADAGQSLDLRQLVESYRSGVRADERRRKAEQLAATHATRAIADPLTLTLPGPTTLPFKLEKTHSTLHASNILSIANLKLPRRSFDTGRARYVNTIEDCLVTTAADKRIVFSNARTGEVEEILEAKDGHQAAVLSVAQDSMDPRCLISSGMDAKVVVWDLLTRQPIQVLSEHSKFVVKVVVSPTGEYMASIGYDKKLVVYRRTQQTLFVASTAPSAEEEEDDEEDEVKDLKGPRYEKVFEMETQTNPEAILFVRAAVSPNAAEVASELASGTETTAGAGELVIHEAREQRTWLCFTVRNDCFIHYIALPLSADASVSSITDSLSANSLHDSAKPPSATSPVADWSLHSFNTNPNPSDLHVSYSLLSLSLHPSSLYICVQTGDHTSPALASTSNATAPGSLSRLLLLAPLSAHRAATIWTGVPTSSYAVPRHSWLPSGRACWLNAEDGVLRLVDLKGRTRATVLAHGVAQDGEDGERTAAASWSRGGNTIVKDVVVLDEGSVASCGFDRTVRIVTLEGQSLA
ncbi:WD40 repeat [Kalmanozyma brasiliensis GHG001]|uniref:Uncharacterized protein n=1 Tax=Kalmanozyma brasiliensis (strain GHG001) TaxID=1365824 RepID=V5ETM5_KALBG|nr:WD40 repeat [Kalmanozyma brasiliensis GHG001]EST08615.1 WD40 repeat [Kalmanozyma brasiliensis GHG001]